MYRKLRLVPCIGNTALSIALICSLLLHSACSVDEKDFQHCGWYDTERCVDERNSEIWECLKEVFDCDYGKQLHCARHYTNRSKMIYGCAESKECLPGEAPYLDKIERGKPTDEFHVTCANCHDKEHFNDMKKNSSTYAECQQKTKCDPEHGIECNPVDINSKDVYKRNRECRCNTFEDYMFGESLEGLCTSNKFIANHCYRAAPCGNGMERVQNGTCVPKCEQGHRTKYSDECIEDPDATDDSDTTTRSEVSWSTTSTTKNPNTSESSFIQLFNSSIIQSSTTVTSNNSQRESSDSNKVIVIVIVSVVVTAVITSIVVIAICKRRELVAMCRRLCNRDNESDREDDQSDHSHDSNVKMKFLDPAVAARESDGDDQPNSSNEQMEFLDQALAFRDNEPNREDDHSNGNNAQMESPDQGLSIRGQTVVYQIHGDFYNLKGTKTVKFWRYGNGNRIKEKAKDDYQEVGNEPTTPPKSQPTEIMNDVHKVFHVKRELGGALLDDNALVKENEISTGNLTKMLTDGSGSDLLQKDQSSCDKLADQSNIPEGERKEPSTAITDTDPFQDLRNAVNDLNPLSCLQTLASKSTFEEFLKEQKSIEGLELYIESFQLFQEIKNNPDISSEFYESDQNKYCPNGFQRLVSTGDGNCLFNSISILLFGNEYFAPFLRLLASMVAARKWTSFAEHAIANAPYEAMKEQIICELKQDIMSTAVDKRYMGIQHVQFLSNAIKRSIVQYFENENIARHLSGLLIQDKDKRDRLIGKDLHILWIRSGGDTNKGEDHIVPLLIKEET